MFSDAKCVSCGFPNRFVLGDYLYEHISYEEHSHIECDNCGEELELSLQLVHDFNTIEPFDEV